MVLLVVGMVVGVEVTSCGTISSGDGGSGGGGRSY